MGDMMATTPRPFRAALVALTLVALTTNLAGCGLLFAGGTTEVTLETDPPGAAVYIDGKPRGTTPLTVEVDNKHRCYARLSASAADPRDAPVARADDDGDAPRSMKGFPCPDARA
jgi:hypothetical protein